MTIQTRGRFALLLFSIVLALGVGIGIAQQPAPPPIPAAVRAAKLEDMVPVDPLIKITRPSCVSYTRSGADRFPGPAPEWAGDPADV